jgi:hydrogenase nickel incorporation protein HypA/HybF
MHELSIALSLIDVACEEAQRRRARAVALHVRVGPLSGVVAEALLSAFELAREGTPLEDSRLEIEQTPILMDCHVCRVERPVVSLHELRCAECGAPAAEIVGGRELELTALEITS